MNAKQSEESVQHALDQVNQILNEEPKLARLLDALSTLRII